MWILKRNVAFYPNNVAVNIRRTIKNSFALRENEQKMSGRTIKLIVSALNSAVKGSKRVFSCKLAKLTFRKISVSLPCLTKWFRKFKLALIKKSSTASDLYLIFGVCVCGKLELSTKQTGTIFLGTLWS